MSMPSIYPLSYTGSADRDGSKCHPASPTHKRDTVLTCYMWQVGHFCGNDRATQESEWDRSSWVHLMCCFIFFSAAKKSRWHRGSNRANQPENEMEKLSWKATWPIIWYHRSTAASVEAGVGSIQPGRSTRLCKLQRQESTCRMVSLISTSFC